VKPKLHPDASRYPRPRFSASAGALAVLAVAACSSGTPAPAPAPDAASVSAADAAAPDAAAASSDAPVQGGATGSDGAPAGGAPAADAAAIDSTSSAWPAVADYAAPGPFATTRDNNTGPGAAYDVFRPAQLGAGKTKHPIISWANGTLFGIADYARLLDHWASHGFVVIAGHSNSTAGGGTHKAAIDWMLAENGRQGSPYFDLLDGKKIGAAGHSQGGGATLAAASNKPGPTGILASISLMPILSFESDKTVVMRQTAPMLNINATMDDRDPTGAVANQIYAGAATSTLVQAAFIGIHEDAMQPPMRRPTVAWFRLQLMGDEHARALFYPAATCGLCADPAWKQVRYRP
jgi:hypothetical protein